MEDDNGANAIVGVEDDIQQHDDQVVDAARSTPHDQVDNLNSHQGIHTRSDRGNLRVYSGGFDNHRSGFNGHNGSTRRWNKSHVDYSTRHRQECEDVHAQAEEIHQVATHLEKKGHEYSCQADAQPVELVQVIHELKDCSRSLAELNLNKLPPVPRQRLRDETFRHKAIIDHLIDVLLARGSQSGIGGACLSDVSSRTSQQSPHKRSSQQYSDQPQLNNQQRSLFNIAMGFEGEDRQERHRDASARGWNTPSWKADGFNPYNPARCVLGREYYQSFPYPWNAMPQENGPKANEMLKITAQALPKFNGEKSSFLGWRSAFIPCVHLVNADVSLKVLLLRSSIDSTVERMKVFVS